MQPFTFPTDAAMLAAFESILDQLDTERRHADPKDKAELTYWRNQHNSFAKAFANYRSGARPDFTGSSYLVTSATRPIVHRVRRVGEIWLCSCEATALCWHAAMVATVERALELIEQGLIDGGTVPPDQPPDEYPDVPAGPGEPTYQRLDDPARVASLVSRLSAARAARIAA